MVGHLIGAAKAGASPLEMIRQQALAARRAADHDGNALDACNDLQVRDHADLTPAQRIVELHRLAPRAVRGRLRVPRPLRAVSVSLDAGGSTAPGTPDRLRLHELRGAVIGRYDAGEDGPQLAVDAIELCRVLSGRADPDDLTDSSAARALLHHRLVF